MSQGCWLQRKMERFEAIVAKLDFIWFNRFPRSHKALQKSNSLFFQDDYTAIIVRCTIH